MEGPYGSWRSPITAERIAAGSVRLSDPSIADGYVWWIEGRPLEGGRQAVVRARPDGSGPEDAFGPDWSARTRVHEYGGGSYALAAGELVFSNDADGRVYRGTTPLTPEPSQPRALRYADFEIAGDRILCVRESHEGDGEAIDEIVSLDGSVIATGHDFYAAPRVSPD